MYRNVRLASCRAPLHRKTLILFHFTGFWFGVIKHWIEWSLKFPSFLIKGLKHCCNPKSWTGVRSVFLQLCCLVEMEIDQYDRTKMKECLPVLRNVLHSCINRQGTDFIAIVILFLLGQWFADFTCACVFSLLASLFAWCFTVNHRGKPGPLLWPLFRWFHGLSSCFAALPGDKQVLSPVLFVSGMLPDPQLCIPPPLLQRYFVRKGAWSSANPNRDLPVCPLSGLTLAGVAFLQTASIWAPESLETDRQSLNC